MVGPLLVHVQEPLEVTLVGVRLVDHQLALFLGGGVGRLAILRSASSAGGSGLFLEFEHRVFFHLLLDPLLQRQDRQLQDLHRLDHPRRQHLLLHQPEILTERKTHGNNDEDQRLRSRCHDCRPRGLFFSKTSAGR